MDKNPNQNILDLPIEEQKKIISQFEVIRQQGKYNMLDFFAVQQEANNKEFFELVNFTGNNSKNYNQILTHYSKLFKEIDLDFINQQIQKNIKETRYDWNEEDDDNE